MKIYLGSDHAGFQLKEKLKEYVTGLGYEVEDKGASFYDKDDDYPDFIKLVAEAVSIDKESKGIIIGTTGEGEAMCANRVQGVRATTFYGPKEPVFQVDISGRVSVDNFEIIKLGRMHNNANILSLGASFMSEDEAKFAVELFLATKFSGDERHVRRINKF